MQGDSELEILVKLRDEASKAASALAKKLKGSFGTLGNDFSAIAKDLKAGTLTWRGALDAAILSVRANLIDLGERLTSVGRSMLKTGGILTAAITLPIVG